MNFMSNAIIATAIQNLILDGEITTEAFDWSQTETRMIKVEIVKILGMSARDVISDMIDMGAEGLEKIFNDVIKAFEMESIAMEMEC